MVWIQLTSLYILVQYTCTNLFFTFFFKYGAFTRLLQPQIHPSQAYAWLSKPKAHALFIWPRLVHISVYMCPLDICVWYLSLVSFLYSFFKLVCRLVTWLCGQKPTVWIKSPSNSLILCLYSSIFITHV